MWPLAAGNTFKGLNQPGFSAGKRTSFSPPACSNRIWTSFPKPGLIAILWRRDSSRARPITAWDEDYKAAKEEIVGLLTALELYQTRDLENELQTWSTRIQIIVKGLAGLDGIKASFVYPGGGGRPVPEAHIQVDEKKPGSPLGK